MEYTTRFIWASARSVLVYPSRRVYSHSELTVRPPILYRASCDLVIRNKPVTNNKWFQRLARHHPPFVRKSHSQGISCRESNQFPYLYQVKWLFTRGPRPGARSMDRGVIVEVVGHDIIPG